MGVPPFQTDPFASTARHDAIMQLEKVTGSQREGVKKK